MRALCLLRDGLAYRREAFLAGLTAAGCKLVSRVPARLTADDVLVIWNRYGGNHELAREYEMAGGRVLVTENGHLGKSFAGRTWYALALNHHAGAGDWSYGGPQRWDDLGVALQPFRTGGSEYLILAQRGIGEPNLRSPPAWAVKTLAQITKYGFRARIRPHPAATLTDSVPIEDDLRDAAGVVTWHSAAAMSALLLGVPVWYDCPTWLGRGAARPLSDLLKGAAPLTDDGLRLAMFRHVAWAMWELEEIAAGDPFQHLLANRETVTA